MSDMVLDCIGPKDHATATSAVTGSSTAAVSLGNASNNAGPYLVSNASADWCFVRFGASGVGAATTADTPVAPNAQIKIDVGGSTHFRVIGASGTVYLTPLAN